MHHCRPPPPNLQPLCICTLSIIVAYDLALIPCLGRNEIGVSIGEGSDQHRKFWQILGRKEGLHFVSLLYVSFFMGESIGLHLKTSTWSPLTTALGADGEANLRKCNLGLPKLPRCRCARLNPGPPKLRRQPAGFRCSAGVEEEEGFAPRGLYPLEKQ